MYRCQNKIGIGMLKFMQQIALCAQFLLVLMDNALEAREDEGSILPLAS